MRKQLYQFLSTKCDLSKSQLVRARFVTFRQSFLECFDRRELIEGCAGHLAGSHVIRIRIGGRRVLNRSLSLITSIATRKLVLQCNRYNSVVATYCDGSRLRTMSMIAHMILLLHVANSFFKCAPCWQDGRRVSLHPCHTGYDC